MTNGEDLKNIVKDKYGSIARTAGGLKGCGCSCSGDCSDTWTMDPAYAGVEGYVPEADLGLGCGLPVQFAGIKPGQTVVDLGAGAGNDVFIARRIVGGAGRVIGVDMTQEMIDQAQRNTAKLGYDNVDFKLGDIEALPLPDGTADVVISNCVLNLVPDKTKAFAEILRVLKPGAHFCISDIVLRGELPEKLRAAAEMYAGCVSGALQENEYLDIIRAAGFAGVKVEESKRITLPDGILGGFLDADALARFRDSDFQVLSITVTGRKP
ncbi:MAG: arsenite methyltransferase [Candidatus Aminicenantales bacterium]